jgi:hypothetical protein
MRVLQAVLFVLFLPFLPLHWLICRLHAKPCPECGEKWLTELDWTTAGRWKRL